MKLIKGDALKNIAKMDDNSINLIICDLPYGSTACNWDTVINIEDLWYEYNRVLTKNGTAALFGTEPFSTLLRNANINNFKYDWIWVKNTSAGFIHAKNAPLKKHEIISMFSKGDAFHKNLVKNRMTYNPQGLIPVNRTKKVRDGLKHIVTTDCTQTEANNFKDYKVEFENYPTSILKFNLEEKRVHPTQKPIKLYEYLIKTYSNPGDVILDNCAGSGTLGMAGLNVPDREYIMIELEPKYQDIIIERLPEIKIIEGTNDMYLSKVLTIESIKTLLKQDKTVNDILTIYNISRIELEQFLKKNKTNIYRLKR